MAHFFKTALFMLVVFVAMAPEPSRAAKSAPCVNDAGLTLPPGFCATIFADKLGHRRQITVAPNGVVYSNAWIYSPKDPDQGPYLVAMKDSTGKGKADRIERFGAKRKVGSEGGTGIQYFQGYLYAELDDKIIRYRLGPNDFVPKGKAEVIVSELPTNGNHGMHPFIIDEKGALFVDLGSATNSCQEKDRAFESKGIDPCVELETRGGVWRFDARKKGQVFSPKQRYAKGIRNAEGFALMPDKSLLVTQHGRDDLVGSWPKRYKPEDNATMPAEELFVLKEGGDYGWPYCYFDPFQNKRVLAPEYGGDGKEVGRCAGTLMPIAVFPAHWAPNSMTRYNQRAFPKRYQEGVFIAFHGSWNRAPYQQGGFNIAFQPIKNQKASGKCEIFADGFAGATLTPAGAEHRPTGVTTGPDGALYVSDDKNGRIYRIVYTGKGFDETKIRLCPPADQEAGPIVDFRPEHKNDSDYKIAPGATLAMAKEGDALFHGAASCTTCHGSTARGSSMAPDLADKEWIWGDGSYDAIRKSIRDGIAKPKQFTMQMPSYQGQLTKAQIDALAAYVWNLSH